VLIFYAWTAVIALSCLFFFVFQPYWFALGFLLFGVVVCTVVTLAPLGRRKAAEVAAQTTPEGTGSADTLAVYDPLDEASDERDRDAPIPDVDLAAPEKEHR
jgi:UDP-GlcNAc:undecaprenyl-phosphate/decaprenyl-phosphate GlcNAc-1-phosphate transferase